MSDPALIHEAIIEAAARALRDKVGSATFAGRTNLLPLSLDDLAQAVLAAVTPLIRAADVKLIEENIADLVSMTRAAALEEAAKVAEEYRKWDDRQFLPSDPTLAGDRIATAIRALKEQP